MRNLSRADLDVFAWVVRRLGADEPEIGQVALGWSIRNRVGEPASSGKADVVQVCRQLLAEHGDDPACLPASPDAGDRNFRHALSLSCRIWNDELADPTFGATHFHGHDELPRWARHVEPVALLGSRFFYVLPGRMSDALARAAP